MFGTDLFGNYSILIVYYKYSLIQIVDMLYLILYTPPSYRDIVYKVVFNNMFDECRISENIEGSVLHETCLVACLCSCCCLDQQHGRYSLT